MTSPVIAALLLVSTAATPRLAMMPLHNGEGVTEQTAQSVTDALTAELRKTNAAQLITPDDLSAALGIERQKQLLGCSEQSCFAEIAGALNVDQIVTGSLARLGQSWLLQVQRLDAKKGTTIAQAARRKKGGSIDDVLDELPSVAKELFAGMPAQPKTVATNPSMKDTTPSPAATPTRPARPGTADVVLKSEVDRTKLIVLSDGSGHYVSVQPFAGLDGWLFAGDDKSLYLQRVFGGGSKGNTEFEVSFWEPRARFPGEASLEFRDGKYTLTCGKNKVTLKKLSPAAAKKLLGRAKLYDVRWRRYAYALARDEEGNYFYVDHAREPEDNTDFNLFVGNQGHLNGERADVLAHDDAGDIFRIGAGKLKVTRSEAEWITSAGKTKLTFLPVEDHARFVYSQLGAYANQPLGTPCDGHF